MSFINSTAPLNDGQEFVSKDKKLPGKLIKSMLGELHRLKCSGPHEAHTNMLDTLKEYRKKCSQCKAILSLFEFSRCKSQFDGLQTICKYCCKHNSRSRRAEQKAADLEGFTDRERKSNQLYLFRSLLKKFGLTISEYEILAKNGCAICHAKLGETWRPARRSRYCLDHDHATGKFRGLLCGECNSAIGLLGEDIDRLQNAISYLLENKQ